MRKRVGLSFTRFRNNDCEVAFNFPGELSSDMQYSESEIEPEDYRLNILYCSRVITLSMLD